MIGFRVSVAALIVLCSRLEWFVWLGGDKTPVGSGDLFVGFAGQFDQRMLKKFNISLQSSGTALHLLLCYADFHPANVLSGCG